jgi:hypothetical protein
MILLITLKPTLRLSSPGQISPSMLSPVTKGAPAAVHSVPFMTRIKGVKQQKNRLFVISTAFF